MTKQGALEELISSMFNDAELRSFLGQMADTAPLLAGIPGASASPLQVMFETIRILDRHGIIDGEFFRALAAARPRLRQKIQKVAVIWGLTLPAGSESLVPSSSSSTPPTAGSTVSPTTVMLSTPAAATPLPADVAILIALEEEWEVFWPIAGEPGGVKDDSGGYLYHFEVPSLGRPYRCVALFMGAMGPGQATQATARLLATRPKTLVNLGIAAAIHDDLKLCDVVVAEQVDDFLSTVKAVPEGPGGWAFELRGSVYRTTHALVQDLINLKFAHRDAFNRWRSACAPAMAERAGQLGKALAAKHLREAPAITNVHLASGPVLAAAEAFSEWLRTRDGLLKALEMEAAGMLLLAHQQADPARTLVLRGISDFGDERKSQTDRDSGGAFRHLAMFNATQLLWAMMYQGLLPRHAPVGVEAIEVLGAVSGTPDPRAAWRRNVTKRLDGRLILRGVDGAGILLDPVYVELELLLQPLARSGVLREDKGRCGEPRRSDSEGEEEDAADPGEQLLDLAAWLAAPSHDASILAIEGEVGTGKTELLVRAARALAGETGDAPLPLWIDAKHLTSGTLARAVADWSGWTEEECRALLQRPLLKFAVFVDSLDESGSSLPELIAVVQGTLGARLHRFVLATRSTQRRALRDVRVARLAPWTAAAIDRFLAQWALTDPDGVAQIQQERALGLLAEVLANPLTATFCVLVAREEPRALRNRTRLFHAIVARIVSHWSTLRTPSHALFQRWDTVVPWLSRLALERLRDHPSGLTIEVLRERLQDVSLDGSDALIEVLSTSYGVLIRTPQGYDFALRWLAEYLAGRALRVDFVSMEAVAGLPWAFEAVRHAISGAPNEQVAIMLETLLAGEDEDLALDAPVHLRKVHLAAIVAADLRDMLPPNAVIRLAPAIWRRLTDEGSVWIASETARIVRSLARVGGPLWAQLEPQLLAVLLDPRQDLAQWYNRQVVEGAKYWHKLLRHRDPKVCIAAIGRLQPWIDDARTRDILFAMLLDERWHDSPALAAGLALRSAARDADFVARIPSLQRLLRDGEQFQVGAAALTLLPQEAEPGQLALGLHCAHNAGGHVRRALRELADSPGGTAALDRSMWKEWRTEEHPPQSTRPEPDCMDPPATGYIRWNLLCAIAPALHRLPREALRDLVHTQDYIHGLSHELDQIDSSVLPEVVDMMCDGYICGEKVESIVRLARHHPDVGRSLIARWSRIVDSGMSELACIRFPGEALAPLVEEGSEEAAEVLVEWLPRSRHGQPKWANDGPPLAAAVFRHPNVLAIGRKCLLSQPGRVPWDTRLLKRLAPAWQGLADVWSKLTAMLNCECDAAAYAWSSVTEVCTHAMLPESFATSCVDLAQAFIARHGASQECLSAWHNAAPYVLRFVEAHGLTPRVRHALEWLAGLQGESPCELIRPMAVAMVISTVSAENQRALADAMARQYVEHPTNFSQLTPAAFAALIRPAPQVWQQLLLNRLGAGDASTLFFGLFKGHLRLLHALPARERGEVAMHLLRMRDSLDLPWFKPLDNSTIRYYRPADLLWQLAFEAGIT
jgi:nucleoside phosphorylase